MLRCGVLWLVCAAVVVGVLARGERACGQAVVLESGVMGSPGRIGGNSISTA
jgi:hypothetical protein